MLAAARKNNWRQLNHTPTTSFTEGAAWKQARSVQDQVASADKPQSNQIKAKPDRNHINTIIYQININAAEYVELVAKLRKPS